MIRPSSLNIAIYCDLSPVLSERYPSVSDATERGNLVDGQVTAWVKDGTYAADPDAKACVEWICETFDQTEWELHSQKKVALVSEGILVTAGTPDLVAVTGERAVVVDFKKKEQFLAGRLAEPDRNLQLHTYGLASATHYRTCLLLFGDGKVEAIWSQDYTPENTGPILERIKQTCKPRQEEPRGTSGDHCGKCWPRIHCPHWALRGHKGVADPTRLERENAGELLLETVAMEEMAKRNREILKHMVDIDGPFRVGDREFRRVMSSGKVTIDGAALERDGLYEQYAKVGRAFPTYRLCRPEKEKSE